MNKIVIIGAGSGMFCGIRGASEDFLRTERLRSWNTEDLRMLLISDVG